MTTVKRRKFMLLATALVALNVFFWLATTGLALPRAIVNQFFGSRMIRAEVILQGAGGSPEDWLIDRGVITTVSSAAITLREQDGRSVPIPLDPGARVQGPVRFAAVSRLRPRLHVVVYHQANAPAQLVQVEGSG
jgi:hypothetical protein